MRPIGEKMINEPDLYNPLWVDMTLAFALSVVGNISNYMKNRENYSFDYSFVIRAFSTVFFLALVIPFVLILFSACYAERIGIVQSMGIVGIYSYANVYFIIASLLTLLGIKLLNLIVLFAAGFLALVSLNLNYAKFWEKFNKKAKTQALIFITVFAVLQTLAYYLVFF